MLDGCPAGCTACQSTFVERRDVAVVVGQGVRHKQDGVDLTEVGLHFGHQSGLDRCGSRQNQEEPSWHESGGTCGGIGEPGGG